MASSLFPGGGSAPAVRKPVLEVKFGSGSSEDWQRAALAVTVEAGPAPAVDVAEVYLSGDDEAPAVAVGDSGTVSLGYEDDSTDLVFTGQVEVVSRGVQGLTRLVATNGGAPLSRLRVNQSYESQKAGQIVSDLANQANVGTDQVQDGLDFPFYVVDDRGGAYQQIAALALKSGFLAYFTPEGKLFFGDVAAGQPAQSFSYGTDLLGLEVEEGIPPFPAVAAVGEGAAGSQGQETWSWLVKDPSSVKGSGGQGQPERLLPDPTLRSANSAQSAADARAKAAGLMAMTGRLLAAGAPAVVVGARIEIAGAPRDALNGQYLVRGVRHRFSKGEGFMTVVYFHRAGGGGTGGLP